MASLSAAKRSLRAHLPESAKRLPREARRRLQARGNTPELTVVIPSYNVVAYIGECLESVLSSRFENLEVIVVDDGSTDGTWEAAKEFAARDHRVQVLRQENSGQGLARNRGVDHARGEFLAFIDADDTVPKRAFDYMIRTLRQTGSDFCVGSARRFSNKRYITTAWANTVHLSDRHRTTLEEFPLAMHDIIACNRVFRTDFWRDQVGGFRGHIAYEDHVPMLTAYVRAEHFDILSGVTYNWRIREDRTSTSQQKAHIENLFDRIAVKEEAHELLLNEASQVVYDLWVARALEVDFPAFVPFALSGSDMYRAVLTAAYRTLLARATPEAMADVRFMQKARAWLVANDRWDDVESAEDFFRETRNFPVTNVEDGRIVAAAQDFLSDAPDDIRELSPLETRFDGALSQVRWLPDGRLEIHGWGLIRALDMPQPESTEVWLSHVDGSGRVDLEITQVADPGATQWGNQLHSRYDGGGFRAVLDPRSLDRGLWQLHVRIGQRGVVREGTIHRYVSDSSADAPAARALTGEDGVVLAHPRHSRQHGFVVEVTTPPVALVHADADATSASGQLQVAPGTEFRRLFLRCDDTVVDLDVAADRQGVRSFAVDLADQSRPGPWNLRADIGGEKPIGVTYALDAAPQSTRAGHWDRRPNASAALATTPTSQLIDSVDLIEDSLVVGVYLDASSATDPAVTGLRLVNPRVTLAADAVEAVRDNYFRLTFPLTASVLGGPALPLPTGWLRLKSNGGTGPAWAASPALIEQTLLTLDHPTLRVEVGSSAKHGARLAIRAPLRPEENSPAGQRSLQVAYQSNEAPLTDSVFFQCYRGETATDSQRALDEALRIARPDLTRYWGVRDYSVAIPEGSVPVLFGSREWYDAIATSRYLCNNIDFDGWFRKRPGQRYLQTFHGYPFKSMGRGFWAGKGFSEERIARELDRRNTEYDAILVPSERAAGFYRDEYDYTGTTLVTGYPRSDFPVVADRDRVRREVLERLGVDQGQTVILYAPTYRDQLTTRTYAARLFDELDLDELTRRLGSGYTVLLRGHNNNQRESGRVTGVAQVVDVTDYPEINDLTVAADAAILDYSSLRFDWALTGKPMVFFVPDQDTYFGQRPPLFTFEESAPGPRLTTTAQVGDALSDLEGLLAGQKAQIAAFNETFNGLHDGQATQRVIREFFTD